MHTVSHNIRRATLVPSVLVALVAGATVGCSGTPSETSRARAAAVRIEAEGCQSRPSIGGGSFVTPHHVLTVAHVVAGSTDIDVILSDGKEADAQVVAIDRKKDLAVLKVETTGEPLPRGTMRPGSSGIFVVWRDDDPVAKPFTARSFVDINASDIDHAGPGLRRGYQIDAEVAKGDSGSLLVHDGRAVAVFEKANTTIAHVTGDGGEVNISSGSLMLRVFVNDTDNASANDHNTRRRFHIPPLLFACP